MATLGAQLYQLGVMVLAGAAVGLFFDFYRVLRFKRRPGKLATAVYDLLFWVLVTLTVLGAVFYASWGDVRVYVFAGLAIGAFVYFRLASPVFLRLLRFVWDVCERTFLSALLVFRYGVLLPLRIVGKAIARVVVVLLSPAHAICGFACKKLKDAIRKPPNEPPTQA